MANLRNSKTASSSPLLLSSSPFGQLPSPSSSPMTSSRVEASPRRMSISCLPYLLTVTVILLCCTPVQSLWCTRLITHTTIKPYVVQATCTQSYQEACGFWTYEMCTQYEEVPCMQERNKTLTLYKIEKHCCPGYRLNPLNNLTCERIDIKMEEGHDGRVEFYQSESDGKLFGLTKGAYAGIVCSAAFLLCVVILVSIRLYKRQRNNRLKSEKKQVVELEATQSMMSKADAQSVA
ncbi:hypothetical protein ElyMa_006203300 [Elysia marginata]|uniref:EMI domain-containing protein n=1 Tax=Elysia marginata TaxID=1093978 RepID=A0AAV4H4U9_9GAST|nr:hypothetical protein ElyMa_006203300 [Elysia marginata]